jgi:hypothetical protein
MNEGGRSTQKSRRCRGKRSEVGALLKEAENWGRARDLGLAVVNYAVVVRLGKARLGSEAGAARLARERS